MIELLQRAGRHSDRPAIVCTDGTFSYSQLVAGAVAAAARLLDGAGSLNGARVVTMIPPSFSYVAVQWGIWLAGGIAVPVALKNPDPEIEYLIGDADVASAVGTGDYVRRLEGLVPEGVTVHRAEELVAAGAALETLPPANEDALILYTSGTTGRPKGVVWRHGAIESQAEVMSRAWRWQADDRALLVLPLHHVHGLINVVTTALWNGATVEMHQGFDADAAWARLGSGEISVFMAVPTIYRRLLSAWETFSRSERDETTSRLHSVRLMVSGSAALPVATLDAWREVSGHVLLERYGMTEIGMALSNSYDGERIPGAVGHPLPTVEARIVDDSDRPVAPGVAGRLQIRGPSVFGRYWRRPRETADAFIDGWFRTGDVAEASGGVYRILGRESVDIIKTGGEKVSALEVEDVLRLHPAIADCAVVGIADPDWGERVVAAVIPIGGGPVPELHEVREFCRQRLAREKIPRQLVAVQELPRNALGKVIKPRVKELVASGEGAAG